MSRAAAIICRAGAGFGANAVSAGTLASAREQWLEIPVPAIVDAVTFARVRQRLEDNKRFAARKTKVPSLLQGPGRLLGLRIRVLPHHQQEDLPLPMPGL